MPLFICTACGTQFPESDKPPAQCPICEEERQYVPARGQTWTTLEALSQSHMNALARISSRALSASAPVSRSASARCCCKRRAAMCCGIASRRSMPRPSPRSRRSAGCKAIAISHPHFYTTMVEWAKAFDCPVYVHAADKEWIMRPDPAIQHVGRRNARIMGRRDADPLRRSFRGGSGAALAGREQPRGIVCSGDILTVATDRKWLSFMRSYPNFIPLSAREVEADRRGDGAVSLSTRCTAITSTA